MRVPLRVNAALNAMKHLFIIRHGDFSYSDLTSKGREEITHAAADIVRIVKEGSVAVLSSPAPRAVQSGEIIAAKYHAPVRTDQCLAEHGISDLPSIDRLVEQYEGHEAVIIVTHAPVVAAYTIHTVKKRSGRDETFQHSRTGEGFRFSAKGCYPFPDNSNTHGLASIFRRLCLMRESYL